MKIKWSKSGPQLEGRVGSVLCFYLIKDRDKFQLVSDLPETVPYDVGRHVEIFSSPQKAMTYAARMLHDWTRRFEGETE